MTSSPIPPLIVDFQEILSKSNASAKISQYLDLLEQENKKINLVSRETTRRDLEKLAAESLVPFEILKERKFENYLDIGSGGGFPSFPIMLTFEIGNAVLIERTKKKAAALTRFAQSLNLQVHVHDQNLEECRFDQKFDLITLRLVRLSKPILSHIENLLTPAGAFIYYAHFDQTLKSPGLNSRAYTYTNSHDSQPKSFTVFSR